jgi:hypothetical protein|eukprot:COSAG06_NODE_504_length_14946_cov_34.563750_11_plen_52_part_00
MCAGGFYPDGIVLAGVTKTMAEQYAPEQLENGPYDLLSNNATWQKLRFLVR